MGKETKRATTLTFNLAAHTLSTGKDDDDDKVYQLQQILQLIKSRSDKRRLSIRFDGARKRKG
jgi:hypothetical protein